MKKQNTELGHASRLQVQDALGRQPRGRSAWGRQLIFAAWVLLLPFSSGWSQEVVIDNLPNADQGNLTVLSNVRWANAFTTDGTDLSLHEVKVSLALPGNSTSDLMVGLWNDAANLPGNTIVSLSTGLNPTAPGIFTYTPVTPATLTANTTYWVVLSVASGNGQYDWNSTLSAAQTGVGTIGGAATYFGGAWIASPASDKGIFAVSGLPVPEPSSLCLAAMIFTAGVLLRQRRPR